MRYIYLVKVLDSQEQAHIHENYDLCIVIAETAFEVYLQERLIEACKTKDIKLLSVGTGKSKKDKNYKEAIIDANVGILIKEYLKIVTGKNLAEGREYTNWHKYAYSLRNDIVHKGKRGADNEAAGKAFTAIVGFIQLIDGILGPTTENVLK